MSLTFLASNKDKVQIGGQELRLLSLVYAQHFTIPATVELSLLSLDEVRKLNKESRGINEATDVLSFPLFQNFQEMEVLHLADPLLIGSIVICPEKAEIYHETLPQLVHHGLLHLFGFDHETNFKRWYTEEAAIVDNLTSAGLTIPAVSNDFL